MPLHITSEPLERRQVRLTVVVPPERFERTMRSVAKEIARRGRFPGYRPGKVPLAKIVALVGEVPLREEVGARLEREVALEAVRHEQLVPVAPVAINTVAYEPFTVEVIVPLEPQVDLGDYRALRLTPETPQPIDDAVVDAVIADWRQETARREVVADPAAAGDEMTLTRVVGRLDGDVVVDDADVRLFLTPEGAAAAGLPPGLVDGLVGLGAGASATCEATYSEMWPDTKLQGRSATFDVTVGEVATRVEPSFEELAASLGVESTDALRASLQRQLEGRAALEARQALAARAVDALVERARVTYPPGLLEAEVGDLIREVRERVERQGFTWERWLSLQPQSEESLVQDLEAEAERRLKQAWTLIAFGRAEGVAVSRSEVDAAVNRFNTLAAELGHRPSDRKSIQRRIGLTLMSDRVVDRLLAVVTGAGGDGAAAAPSPDENVVTVPADAAGPEHPRGGS